MDAAVTREFTRVDDYLAREEASKIKHEYVAGFVYAVAPTTEAHDQIASNLYVAFRQDLRGRDWKPYLSHVRVHVEALGDVFYYPDVVVGGDRRDTHPSFLRYPKLIVEVCSPLTERLDRREKRWAYQTIENLQEYILVAEDRLEVTVFRHFNGSNGRKSEVYGRLGESVLIKSLDLNLNLASIYEGAVPP